MNEDRTMQARFGRSLEVFLAFLKLGLSSFGGPIAHLAYFRSELVERRRWVSEEQFAQLLAISQFLPGPASSQLGFSLGLLRAGWLGAVAAFVAFTLPSAVLLLAFASALPLLTGPIAQAAVHGLKLVACAVVADAVVSMFKNLCPDVPSRAIAVGSGVALLFASSPLVQLCVIGLAALLGLKTLRGSFASEASNRLRVHYGRRMGGVLLIVFLGLLIGLPLLATGQPDFPSVAQAFYQAGALVFGGGHVVLPWLQEAVVSAGWVASEPFLSGYGASQALPGPLFAFAAYLGAILPPGDQPYLMATVALVFIFLPGFLLVAGILPFLGVFAQHSVVSRAMAGVNAAVVGLLAAALYNPISTSAIVDVADLAIVLVGFAGLIVWRLSPLIVVLWCVFASVLQVTI